MSTTTTPTTWPTLLSPGDYAKACAQVAGKPVPRSTITDRIRSGKLPVEQHTIGGRVRTFVNTIKNPPAATPGRWPSRPEGARPLPTRKPAAS